MTEIKDCLPEHTRKHFINLRNVRLESETAQYQERLRQFRAELAAKNMLNRWGGQAVEEWRYKQELYDSLATGHVQDAFETCRLYDIPLTQPICDCLVKAVDELLEIQYRNAVQAQAHGLSAIRMPVAVLQQGSMAHKKIMPRIRVMVETARVEDEKKRAEMAKQNEKYGDTYTQNIIQHGGVMHASQTGDVTVQQLTIAQLDRLRTALADVRAFFKKQDSVDTDEYAGLLASAEKAAGEKDESKMLGYLKQLPKGAWEISKAVIPQVLLHYLKLRGMA
jgi:hypothetical protein